MKTYNEALMANGLPVEIVQFPSGERHVRTENLKRCERVVIFTDFVALASKKVAGTISDTIIDLCLLVDGLQRLGVGKIILFMPFVPYARQDRVAVFGEALSIKVFANIINSLSLSGVWVIDPHSYVAPALLNNVDITPQDEVVRNNKDVFADYLVPKENTYIVGPDAGSLNKIYKLSDLGVKIANCTKRRNPETGELSGFNVPDFGEQDDPTILIIDDICDGGGTFLNIAEFLRYAYPIAKIGLFVSHGLFTKGVDILYKKFDDVFTISYEYNEQRQSYKLTVVRVENNN